MSDCIFCKIVEGEIPADKVFEDDDILAFRDVNPQAPVHVLLIPKRHIPSLDAAGSDDVNLLGRMMSRLAHVARQLGVAGGYRVVNNCGESAGQSVYHIHLHLLGGRALGWPPG